MSRSRNWVFTLPADAEAFEDFEWVQQGVECPVASLIQKDHVAYLVCQVERSNETHLVHIQGYIQLDMAMRLSFVKALLPRAHWETRRGSHDEAKAYCQKEDTRVQGPFEFGHEVGGQGKRNDLEDILSLVKEKKTNYEILDQVGAGAARHCKAIQFMRFTLAEQESDRQLQGLRVIVLYGQTGTGKTYAAINYIAGNRDYYICEAPSHSQSKLWFDGYEGQKTLILDDFEGSFCPFRFLLRLLDCYKLKVEVKGNFVWAAWTTVVITSNIHPSGWYSSVNLAPLQRRINEIRLVEHQGSYKLVDFAENVLSQDFEQFVQQLPPIITDE